MEQEDSASAFNRLYERLVVQGLPKVRKSKKAKKTKSAVTTREEEQPVSVANEPEKPPNPVATEPPVELLVAVHPVAIESDEMKEAKQSVRRLKLCRNTRRLVRNERWAALSRENRLRMLASITIGDTSLRRELYTEEHLCRVKKRRGKEVVVVDTDSVGRQCIRIEAVTARLFRRQQAPTSDCDVVHVLGDFRFRSPYEPSWQSRIHYGVNTSAEGEPKKYIVPLPPRIDLIT